MIKYLDFVLIPFGILLTMALLEYYIDTVYKLPVIFLPCSAVALGSMIQYRRINRKDRK